MSSVEDCTPRAEAEIALQWASELPGWDGDQPRPVFVPAPGTALVCG